MFITVKTAFIIIHVLIRSSHIRFWYNQSNWNCASLCMIWCCQSSRENTKTPLQLNVSLVTKFITSYLQLVKLRDVESLTENCTYVTGNKLSRMANVAWAYKFQHLPVEVPVSRRHAQWLAASKYLNDHEEPAANKELCPAGNQTQKN